LRTQLRKLNNINDNYMLDSASGKFRLMPSATGNYKNKDNVYADQVSVSGNINDLGSKLGSWAEDSEYVRASLNHNSKFSNKHFIRQKKE